jgi:glycosyltransferase involved in cell wall biosynthesis
MTHVFVHYHLRPGGVTRVLQEEVRVFTELGISCVTLSAGPAEAIRGEHREIPALDYSTDLAPTLRADDLISAVKDLPRPWIWHVHNPTLGCHPSMTGVIDELARAGERMILHIHDFAEDQRPDNLRRLKNGIPWFPVGAHVHYIVLTHRDCGILCDAGLPREKISVLGNPIEPRPVPTARSKSPLILYPTRAITRKNIGELLLLASVSPPAARFATTMGPGASRHQCLYSRWQDLATQLDLPIDWEVAEKQSNDVGWEQCIASATHLVHTSQQEGFGMAFLEAIAWQRPLLGRAIPHIQENLRLHGIDHPFLYDRILIDSHDFAALTPKTQADLIQRAKSDPNRVMIEQQQQRMLATEWLALALSPQHNALPLSLLKPFHPQQHAEQIISIVEQLKHNAPSAVMQLDVSIVERAFSS